MITRNFNLYLNAGHSVPLVINVNQYDSGEQWVFTLYNADGTQYTPSTGAIVGIKSDGLGIINSGSVVDGKVVINETQQMTAAVGKAVFELVIDDGTHGTANFIVLVEEKPGNNADLSETDISMIEQAIEAASNIKPYGSPLVASTVAGMTDHDKVYVYVGSETGYTSGNWYYWDGSAWTSGGVYNSVAVQTDTTLTLSGVAADAKKTGDEISDLKSAIGDLSELDTTDKTDLVSAINEVRESVESGGGLTNDIKQALMDFARAVAFKSDDPTGQTYIDALEDALYAITAITLNSNSLSFSSLGATQQLTATTTPEGGSVTWSSSDTSVATVDQTGLVTSVDYGNATITATSGSVSATCSVVISTATVTSISAVYTQSGNVYEGASLDSLKANLVVTATWSDSTTSTVASTDYTLSGTLAVGTSTVTVAYGGKTTTFNVTVSAIPDYGTFTPDNYVQGYYIESDGAVTASQYGSMSDTYYDIARNLLNFTCDVKFRVSIYDSSKTFVRQVVFGASSDGNGSIKAKTAPITFFDDEKYFRLSWTASINKQFTITNADYMDIHMEIGDISTTTGEDIEESRRIRSVDYVPVSSTSMVLKYHKPFLDGAFEASGNNYGFLGRCYDSSKNFIGSISWTTQDKTISLPANTAFVRPVIQFGTYNMRSDFADYVYVALILGSVNCRIVSA